MKLLLKVILPIGVVAVLAWWLVVAAIPQAIVTTASRGAVRDGVPGNVLVLAGRTRDCTATRPWVGRFAELTRAGRGATAT